MLCFFCCWFLCFGACLFRLMIGELATAMPAEGGFYHWVGRAMGPFWGFQEGWLSLAASVFDMAIYPTTFVLYLTRIAPSLDGRATEDLLLKFAIVGIACACGTFAGRCQWGAGLCGSWWCLCPPLSCSWHWHLWRSRSPRRACRLLEACRRIRDLSGALLVTLWNYMGWDNASTIAQEVEDPQRNYPRAMLSAAAVVTCVYLLPLLAVWRVGIPAERFFDRRMGRCGRSAGRIGPGACGGGSGIAGWSGHLQRSGALAHPASVCDG